MMYSKVNYERIEKSERSSSIIISNNFTWAHIIIFHRCSILQIRLKNFAEVLNIADKRIINIKKKIKIKVIREIKFFVNLRTKLLGNKTGIRDIMTSEFQRLSICFVSGHGEAKQVCLIQIYFNQIFFFFEIDDIPTYVYNNTLLQIYGQNS